MQTAMHVDVVTSRQRQTDEYESVCASGAAARGKSQIGTNAVHLVLYQN